MKDLPSLNINIRPLHQYIQAVEFCNIWATIARALSFAHLYQQLILKNISVD